MTEFLDVAMADEDMQQLASSSNVRNKRERELFFCYFFSYSIVTQSDPHSIIFNAGVTV